MVKELIWKRKKKNVIFKMDEQDLLESSYQVLESRYLELQKILEDFFYHYLPVNLYVFEYPNRATRIDFLDFRTFWKLINLNLDVKNIEVFDDGTIKVHDYYSEMNFYPISTSWSKEEILDEVLERSFKEDHGELRRLNKKELLCELANLIELRNL